MSQSPHHLLANPDFASIKLALKESLRVNPRFRDLNYEGSNISALIDLLAYNTYHNAFAAHMVASESFLDTAQLEESVVSIAKHLGYIPRSVISSRATVKLIGQSALPTVIVPSGTIFNSIAGSESFVFTTIDTFILNRNPQTGFIEGEVELVEGFRVRESFTVLQDDPSFTLSNDKVDRSTITIVDQTGNTYVHASSLLNLSSSSRVFFTEVNQRGFEKIYFGTGQLGLVPPINSVLTVSYLVSDGEQSNGSSQFALSSSIPDFQLQSVQTISAAAGGSAKETIEQIRRNAPLVFQSRSRAVVAEDYRHLLLQRFSFLTDVSAYSGEFADPIQYGVVIVSPITQSGVLSNNQKRMVVDYLEQCKTLTTSIQVVDPIIRRIGLNTRIQYNASTGISRSNVITDVLQAVADFNSQQISRFNTPLRHSNLVVSIDQSNDSILSNDTTLYGIEQIDTKVLSTVGYDINTYNQITPSSLRSSLIVNGRQRNIKDDGRGNVILTADDSIVSTIGEINYQTGRIRLKPQNLNVSGNVFDLLYDFVRNDVNTQANAVLVLDLNAISVEVNPA